MTKVLIVEDDASIRTAYVFAMTKAGFHVIEAGDGAQAVAALENDPPDVVLLDMLMPGMSGLEFLRQTHLASRFPNTKVIAVSNIDTPRVVEDARKLGAVDYVIKVDTTPHQMVDLVNQHIGAKPA